MSQKPENSTQHLIRTVAGVILAGGKSSRFGSNKSFIHIEGTPLIERVVRVVSSVFEHRLIVTNTPEEYEYLGLPMVQDLIKGIGSLGGIYTGLETISNDAGFFVACDMPYLNSELLRHMAGLRDGHDAVVPRINRMFEPLHALYCKTSIGPIRDLIDSGHRQILGLFSRIRVRYVEEEAIKAFEPELRCFANVNRPEDLACVTGGPGDDDQLLPRWPRKLL